MRAFLIMFFIIGILVVVGCSSSDNDKRPFPNREGMPNPEDMPDRDDRFRMNFTLDDESIDEVTEFFENAQSQEEVSEYCAEHRMECGYYCRQVNPSHDFCSVLPKRNMTRPQRN